MEHSALASTNAHYRRTSQLASPTKFSGLVGQKRNHDNDEVAHARKASFHEQKPAMTYFGRKWHEYVVFYQYSQH